MRYGDWDERKPGFFEVDTVANCGISTQGQYICMLTLTDAHSGWTENLALLNKAHRWIKDAVDDVKQNLPFQMKGIDSDNGGEFKTCSCCNGATRIMLSSPEADRIKISCEFALQQTSLYRMHFFTSLQKYTNSSILAFDSQSVLADKINRFLTEQADRLDKVCG